MDIHSRKIRYFLVVAEELHFTRAAARLFIAQQALSKQIRELEDAVGARLFARTSRNVELTPAGEAFLAGARASLAALDAAVTAAQDASQGERGTLRVGFGVGAALELTGPILAEFKRRHPRITLDLHEFPLGDASAGLSDGQSDVALIRVPVGADVECEPLFSEPRVAGLAGTHRLADRPTVTLADLADETITVAQSVDTVSRDYWTLADYPHSGPREIINTGSHTEELELVAAGVACTITVAAAARYTPHPGVRYVRIDGVSGSTVAVAWRTGQSGPLVERFVDVARDVRDREAGLVRDIERPPLVDQSRTVTGGG